MFPSDDPALIFSPGIEATSTASAHQLCEPSSLPTVCEQNGIDTDPAEMDQQPPISHLPPELLVRVLTFVGLIGGPPALRSCLLVCRGFYGVIEDPALDKHIYKAAAFSLLSYDPLLFPPSTLSGARVPPTQITPSAQKQTYKALARNLFLSRQRFPSQVHHTSATCVPDVCPTTQFGPNPGNRDWKGEDTFWAATLPRNEMGAGALPPLSVDPAGRKVVRIIDFVHSCTEASRTFSNAAYVGVKTCGWSDSIPPGSDTTSPRQGETASWILFSDDPRSFPESRDRNTITVQRAAVVGGAPPDPPSCPSTAELQTRRRVEEEAEGSKLLGAIEAPGPPSCLVDLAEQERAKSPFIRPVDHDKFINSQRWGPPEKSIYASIYNAFGTQGPSKGHESPQKDQSGQCAPPGSWLTPEKVLWTMDKVADTGLVGFGKSLLHSDANLRLVPRLVKNQVEVAVVERLAMVRSGGNEVVVNMEWKMPGSIKDLSLDSAATLDFDEIWDGDIKECWEFKSCGAYLLVCDDNSGCRASTVSCFAGRAPKVSSSSRRLSPSAPASDVKWQRKMAVRPSLSSAEYWLDNDGYAVNAAVCAYSTRRHIMPATSSSPERYRAVMEFHLLNLQTGDTVKILNLAEEERSIIRQCCMWCSFTLGDGILIASLGGIGGVAPLTDGDYWSLTGYRRRYGYENVFVWDLGSEPDPAPEVVPAAGPFRGDIKGEVHMTRPTSRVPVPQGWGDLDKYVVLSGCGRYLGVTAGWKTAVWDLEDKCFVGVWRVENADVLEVSSSELGEECPAWSGLWIKWRDIAYTDNASDSVPVDSGMSYISARDLRCAVGGVDTEMDRSQVWMSDSESESGYEGEDGNYDETSDDDSIYTTSGQWWGLEDYSPTPPLPEGGEISDAEGPSEAPTAEIAITDAPQDLTEALGSDGGDVGYMGWAS